MRPEEVLVDSIDQIAGEKQGVAYIAPAPDVSAAAPKKGGKAYLFVKRAFDICFSVPVCIVLAIPVAIACIAISVDSPGAPIFRQERIGKGGKRICIYKLRTMVSDAHDHPEKYMSSDQLETWKREQKLDDDPRVTKVGRFLRRTSLDEIMQFLNVLKGDMSVIGPRPITEEELEQHFTPSEREELLSVRPGITGLWQATERSQATFESGTRQAIELDYVRKASLGLDARIFLATFGAMFVRRTGK